MVQRKKESSSKRWIESVDSDSPVPDNRPRASQISPPLLVDSDCERDDDINDSSDRPLIIPLESGLDPPWQDLSVTPPPDDEPLQIHGQVHPRPMYSSMLDILNQVEEPAELHLSSNMEVEEVMEINVPVVPVSSSGPETSQLGEESEETITGGGSDVEGAGVSINSGITTQPVVKKRRTNKKKDRDEAVKAEKNLKRLQYQKAIQAIKNRDFTSYRKCAKNFGVADTVLRKYILQGTSYVGKGPVNQVLTTVEQDELMEFVKYMCGISYGYTMYDLRLAIQELVASVVK